MLVKAKEFSDQSFHSISKRCWTNFLFDHNPQSVKHVLALHHKKDKISRRNSSPTFHNSSEILGMSDPLLFCKPEGTFHDDPCHLQRLME